MKYTFEDFKAGKVVVTVDPTDMSAFKREVEAAGIRVSDELLEHVDRFYISGCGLVGEFGRLTSMPHVNFRDLAIATPTWADFLAGKIAIKCDTREQYNQLMQECEKAGLRWIAGDEKPTKWEYGYYSRVWEKLPQCVFRFGELSNGRRNPTVQFTTIFPADPWAEFVAGKCYLRVTKDEWVKAARMIDDAGITWPDERATAKRPLVFDREDVAYVWVDKEEWAGHLNAMLGITPSKMPIYPFSAIAAPEPIKPEPIKPEQPKYKVGDKFILVTNIVDLRVGDVVTLSVDDGSDCPFFDAPSGKLYPRYALYWSMLKPFTTARKVIITTDGRTTTAKLIEGKRTIRKTMAVCAPVDEFDLEHGAALAMERLLKRKEATP